MEIRTARGKLVGVLDEGTRVFSYKDRNKVMQIEINVFFRRSVCGG